MISVILLFPSNHHNKLFDFKFINIKEVTRAIGPFFIGELSHYFVNPDKVSKWYPYICAFGLSISSLLYVTFNNIALMDMQTLGWNAKSAVVGLMYKKVSWLEIKLSHYVHNDKINKILKNCFSAPVANYFFNSNKSFFSNVKTLSKYLYCNLKTFFFFHFTI